MMRTNEARSALAEAIQVRNAAAKAVASAETVHDEYERDALSPASSANYKAQEATDAIDEEIKEVGRQYPRNNMGFVGFCASGFAPPEPDEKAVLQHFLRIKGKTPDELRAEAQTVADKARDELQTKRISLARLEAIRDNARADLDEAKSKVEGLVRAVLREPIDVLISEAVAAKEQSLRASAALLFVAGGTDRSLWTGLLTDQNVTWGSHDLRRARQNEGAAPWLAAFNQLFVDADAPLPTDPVTKTAKAA